MFCGRWGSWIIYHVLGSFHCCVHAIHQYAHISNRKLVGSVPHPIGYCVWSRTVRTEKKKRKKLFIALLGGIFLWWKLLTHVLMGAELAKNMKILARRAVEPQGSTFFSQFFEFSIFFSFRGFPETRFLYFVWMFSPSFFFWFWFAIWPFPTAGHIQTPDLQRISSPVHLLPALFLLVWGITLTDLTYVLTCQESPSRLLKLEIHLFNGKHIV